MKNSIILGIDPGSRITGYGIIKVTQKAHTYISSGCIRLRGNSFPDRLRQLYQDLEEIIEAYRPHEVVIEQVFVYKNPNSALKLGQARGVAIMAAVRQGLLLAEYSAREVKRAVVGYGAAEKWQVQHMVQKLLQLSGKPQVDAADALAIALCHANMEHPTSARS